MMLPDPDGAPQVPPPAPTHIQVGVTRAAGTLSVTVTPVAVDGPGFVATIVYVIDSPTRTAECPSVFVMETSAVGVNTLTIVP